MAFEDYGSSPAKNLDKAKELYEKSAAKKDDSKPVRPEKFEPISDKVIKKRKKSPVSRFSEVFFATSPEEAKDHVVTNIFLPAVKELLYDMVSGYFSMFLFDRQIGYRGRGPGSRASDASVYNQAFSRGSSLSRDKVAAAINRGSAPSSSKRMEDDIEFNDMATATEYLDNFREAVSMFGDLSVADVYDKCGLSHSPTDRDWGWTNLSKAYVVRLGEDKYSISFPKPLPLPKRR